MSGPTRPRRARGASVTGLFRIRAIAELTGVAEATLRAWERRYGIPAPERTDAGYRLYGPREVEQVKEMRRLSEHEGLAPVDAARIVRERRDSDVAVDPMLVPSVADGHVWESAVTSILAAIEAFDDFALDRALRRLAVLGPPTVIVDRVVVPALRVVGERWHEGRLTEAHEHMASNRINTFLRGLLQLAENAEDDPRVALGAFADDTHELGLLATALRFSSWGMRPLILGARTSPEAVRCAIEAAEPALVALAVAIPPAGARARDLVGAYADACGDVPWIVGGRGATALREHIEARGGSVAPADAVDLRALVSELLARPTKRKRRPRA